MQAKLKRLITSIVFLWISIISVTRINAQERTLPISSGIEKIDALSHRVLDMATKNKVLYFSPALHLADSIKNLALADNDPKAICTAYANLATLFKFNRNYTLAAQYAQKAIDVAYTNNKNDTYSLPQAYQLMASVCVAQLQWKEALAYYQKALKIYEQDNNTVRQALILSEIGVVYYRSGDFEKTKKYYTQSLALLGNKDKNWEVYFSNRLSSVLMDTKEPDAAIAEAEKAEAILKQLPNPWMLANVIFTKAGAYFFKGDLDNALKYTRQAIELSGNDSAKNADYLTGLASIYEAKGDKAAAESAYLQAIEISHANKNIYTEQQARQNLTGFYRKNGQTDKANKQSLVLMDLKDSIFSKDKAIAIQELEYRYENDKKEEKIAALTAQSRLKNGLITAAAIALLAILIALWNFRKNASLARAFMQQNQETLQQEKETALIEKELEKEQKEKAMLNERLKAEENKRLQAEMDITNRELAAITLYVQEKNKMLEELQEKMNHLLSNAATQNRAALISLSKNIRQSISFESDWDKIKLHFEKVHPGFFRRLAEQFPALTPNELKHCAYIKMNMSNKETANLLNVDYNTVKMSRYRIKKKMNLLQEDDLTQFIQAIA